MATIENGSVRFIDGEPGTFGRPVSAMLGRALAEAAAGYPGDGPVYLVASYEAVPPELAAFNGTFDVQPAFKSYDDAMTWLSTPPLHPGYGIFGPFESTFAMQAEAAQATVRDFAVQMSDGVTVVRSDDLSSDRLEVGGLRFDVLFMSASAVAKFAVPYYARTYSLQFANRVLQEFQESELALMGHYPWSEYTFFDGSGGGGGGYVRPANIPVLFERDGNWRLRPRPLHPHDHELGS